MYYPWREYYQMHRDEDTEPDESVGTESQPPWKNPFLMRIEMWRRKRAAPTSDQTTDHSQSDGFPRHDPTAARG